MVYLADSVRESQKNTVQFDYRLKAGDRIQILVTALNAEAAMAYNLTPVLNTAAIGNMTNTNNIASTGYLVDNAGNIQFPQLGAISVKDKTTSEVSIQIQDLLKTYLKEPVVIINVTNYKVNVMGEVARPGTIIVPDGKITILEAISQSGDLTIYGKRDNVLVVREKNGKRDFGKVDLTSNNLFESPYYYLEQGDVVYIEMTKNKLLLNDADEARKLRIASILLSAVTAIGIIINAINR
jgi:polysaccharide export outer membrane protein